jgi:hypothetical protein
MDSDNKRYPVGRFSKCVVAWPGFVMLFCFIVSAGLASLAAMNNAFDTLGAWSNQESIIVQRQNGVGLAVLEWHIILEDFGKWEVEDELLEDRRRLSSSSSSSTTRTKKSSSLSQSLKSRQENKMIKKKERRLWSEKCGKQKELYDEYSILFSFRDKSGKPLSASSLKTFKQAQKGLYKIPGYKDQCLLNNMSECTAGYSINNWASFLGHDYKNDDNYFKKLSISNETYQQAECLNIDVNIFEQLKDTGKCEENYGFPIPCSISDSSDEDFYNFPTYETMEPMFQAICSNGTLSSNSPCNEELSYVREFMFGQNWDCTTLDTRYTRMYFPAGAPLDDSGSCDYWNYEDEMLETAVAMIDPLFSLKKQIELDNDDITFFFTFMDIFIFFDYYLARDLSLLALSFALVFLVLWIQTSSLFISSCGMYQIFVSFPLGLFIWSVVMDEPGVTYLMYNGIFIILGIGCDDIFVFLDAFRQSSYEHEGISGSLETRFAWAYQRAASSMLATSVTTSLAFAGCATSRIWDIRCFGVVNGFMVFFNYILVITWFPAAVCIYEKYLKYCMPWCTPQILFSSCYRFITCTKNDEKEDEPEDEKGNKYQSKESQEDLDPKLKNIYMGNNNDDENDARKQRQASENQSLGGRMEIFYGGVYSDFVIDQRKMISIAFFFILVGTTAIWTTLLKPATKPFTFFNEEHYFTQVGDINDKFQSVSSDGNLLVHLSYGVKRSNPWNIGGVHPTETHEYYENTGQSANYYHDFSLFDYQEKFSLACSTFHDQMISLDESGSDEYNCWIDDFKKYTISDKQLDFPYTNETLFMIEIKNWLNYEKGHSWSNYSSRQYNLNYEDTDGELSSYGELTGFAYTWDGQEDFKNYDKKIDKIFFTFATFQTSLEYLEDGHANSRLWQLYDDMETALKNTEAVTGMTGGIQTCDNYHIMTLTSYLASSAIINMMVSFAIAVIVIAFATQNFKVTLIASISLYTVISLVFAEMVIFGWSVNLLESVDISIAGGMSVDYILHLVHSYNHQTGTSFERVRKSLAEMGVSVTSGMGTTFIACIALFLTDLLWFKLFGCFIAMVILSAFFTSMSGMMAMLALFGPDSIDDENNDNDDDNKSNDKADETLVVEMTPKSTPRSGAV